MKKQGITFLIAAKNQGKDIQNVIEKCFNQTFSGNIEVILIDDKSSDDTEKIAKKIAEKEKNLVVMSTHGEGRVKGLNKAIFMAKNEFVCLSAGDIFFEKDFARTILSYFTQKDIAFVSPFSNTGGNATVWRKNILTKLSGFDEDFNEKGTGFRDDTDLAFRAFENNYKGVFTYKTAKFKHEHSLKKEGLMDKLRYGWSRIKIHRFDPLLYKKHPIRGKEFFDVKLGFIRNPWKDFEVATGLWKGKFDFSSPQGIVLIKGNSLPKKILIILLGIGYVVLVKTARLYGSIKYGKLLI
jgi:glycosyltransferase involved in cell wall biosynthesis